jgi:hypothetical protein
MEIHLGEDWPSENGQDDNPHLLRVPCEKPFNGLRAVSPDTLHLVEVNLDFSLRQAASLINIEVQLVWGLELGIGVSSHRHIFCSALQLKPRHLQEMQRRCAEAPTQLLQR